MPPPRKKDRLRGSLSPVREQFPPTGTLYGGQVELLGKSRPNEGSKTVPGEAGGCVQAAPMGEGRQLEVSGSGKHRTGLPARTEDTPGRKNSPRRGPEAVWMRDMGVTCPGRSV